MSRISLCAIRSTVLRQVRRINNRRRDTSDVGRIKASGRNSGGMQRVSRISLRTIQATVL